MYTYGVVHLHVSFRDGGYHESLRWQNGNDSWDTRMLGVLEEAHDHG